MSIKKPEPAALAVGAYPWDTAAPIKVRLLRVADVLRLTKLSETFKIQRDFEAFSIHQLARTIEPVLAKHGVHHGFSIEKWNKAGDFALVEGWATFSRAELDSDPYPHRVYTIGEGMDRSDKGFGKAVSYARKNGYIQGLNLATGVDNEASAEERPVDAVPQSIAGAAPAAAALYVLGFGQLPTAVLDADVMGRVAGHVQALANVPAVEAFMSVNAVELSRYWEADNNKGLAVSKIIHGRIEALREKVKQANGHNGAHA